MCKCKWMKKGECTNEKCLFQGYSAVWCCICILKEPVKCGFKVTDSLCGADLPDSYRTCKGEENCKIYECLTESL